MPSTFFSQVRSAVRSSIRRSVTAQEGLLESFGILTRQGKFRFNNYRLLYHSASVASLSELQLLLRQGAYATGSDPLLANRIRNATVGDALSRTFSVPCVPGPSQVCRYQIDCDITDTSEISWSVPMAARASSAVFGEDLMDSPNPGGACTPLLVNKNASLSSHSCRQASMSLKNGEHPANASIYGLFDYNAAKRWCSISSSIETGSRIFHSSSHSCVLARTATDVSCENSACEQQREGSPAPSKQYVP